MAEQTFVFLKPRFGLASFLATPFILNLAITPLVIILKKRTNFFVKAFF